MRLLVLLSRFPYPLDKGDKLRAFHQLRQLAAVHEIYLFVVSDEAVAPDALAAVQPLCRGGVTVVRLHRLGIALGMARALAAGRPLQTGYFHSPVAQRQLDRVIRDFMPEHIYCQLVRMAEYLRSYGGQQSMTLDYMDVFSAGMARRAGQAPAWQRPVLALEARRLTTYEAEVFDWFTHHTIISDQDRQLIQHPQRERIEVVANGIDLDFFQPRFSTVKKFDVLFCGNMAYHPNVDAVVFLAAEIMPLVRQHCPTARLLVAGTTPTARVLALASAHVIVSGWLPDIRDAYASARVFVAPMRVGTGLQNKLLEAMAMQLPSVTTTLANNALRGQSNRDLLVADSAQNLATAIVNLLTDEDFADQTARQGQAFVAAHYNWAGTTAALQELLQRPAPRS